MTEKNFTELMYLRAQDYAESCVYKPEQEREIVETIVSDFMAGAIDAYKILNDRFK